MKYVDAFRNPAAATPLRSRLCALAERLARNVRIMEVCGSHTMAVGRHGIRELLPPNVSLISGPGCPVCVTVPGYIDTAVHLARRGAALTSFGDMLQVPGSSSSLGECRSEGGHVECCYSPRSALETARGKPRREVVFLAIGFETTVAPVVSLVDLATRANIRNLSLLTAFKRVPPALQAVLDDAELRIDAFLCPPHVSAIIGARSFEPFARRGKPCIIAGFEPLDILLGLCAALAQLEQGRASVENLYARVVREEGNAKARAVIERFLRPDDAHWRGLGLLPDSGWTLRDEYAEFDACRRFNVEIGPGHEPAGCLCGDVIKGKRTPDQCPLFAKTCTPMQPVGPCMVSAEGSCSAWHRYERER